MPHSRGTDCSARYLLTNCPDGHTEAQRQGELVVKPLSSLRPHSRMCPQSPLQESLRDTFPPKEACWFPRHSQFKVWMEAGRAPSLPHFTLHD